jgi:hypothetical protein
MLIDWASAWDWDMNIKKNKEEKLDYYGCVSYASDVVLSELAQCESNLETHGYQYKISSPSELSDLISLFRTFHVFTSRISSQEINNLLELRAQYNFVEIINWWKQHLSQNAIEAEKTLAETFKINPQGIYAWRSI